MAQWEEREQAMDGAWDSGEEGIHMTAELLRKTTCSDLIRKTILP